MNHTTSIKVIIKETFFNKREMYFRMKDERKIPLTKVSKPTSTLDLKNLLKSK